MRRLPRVSRKRGIEIAVSCLPCKDGLEPANWVEEGSMDKLSLQNPVFATQVIAATIMIPKAVSMSGLIVVRMDAEKANFSRLRRDRYDASVPSYHAARFARSAAVDEAFPSLMR